MEDMNNQYFKEWKNSEKDDAWIIERLRLCSKPVGKAGIDLAHSMNQDHSYLVDWALEKFTIEFTSESPAGLDIGCGGGATLQKLHNLYPQLSLCGIDYSHDMVELASHNTVEFALIREGNVCELPYHKKQFDLVTAVETLYFWDPLGQALENIYYVLKDNGRLLIIHEMYKDNSNSKFSERNERIRKLSDLALFSPDELSNILKKYGFSNVNYHTIPENNWIVYSAGK